MVVPIVTRKPWALVALILNCIPAPGFTGVGTLMAASNQEDKRLMVHGIIQTVLAATFIGLFVAWPWSVFTGIKVYMRSEPAEVDPEEAAEAERRKEEAAKAKAEAKAAKEAQKAAKAEAKAAKKAEPKKPKKEKASKAAAPEGGEEE